MDLKELIAAAKGEHPVDCLFANARIINVFSGEIVKGHIGVFQGKIVGIGDYPAQKTKDLNDRYVAPGFIDAHVHIESAMTSVSEFAKAVVCNGTTSVIADPHEIANVMGTGGIDYMLRASEHLPVNILFALPSCVPATGMETAGAVLSAESLRPFLMHERIVALGEMMNFPGVLFRDETVMQKIKDASSHNKPLDGHSPGLTGKDLNAYVAAGILSDHECTSAAEALEKLRLGMHIMIREGTGAKNLDGLLPVVNEKTADRIMWCTDDRHPKDICNEGHIDFMIRKAVRAGLDPVTAIRIGTLNPARYFGQKHLGAIAPGRKADMVVFSNPDNLIAEEVYTSGRLTAAGGEFIDDSFFPAAETCPVTMNVRPGSVEFKIYAETERIRIIELVPGQIVTRQRVDQVKRSGDYAVADISRDILKIAVVERHKGTGNIGKAFVSGFGLKKGAIASSVAHDSHNIIVAGASDEDMKAAVDRIIEINGGLTVSCDSKVTAELPLPIAGLMSTAPLIVVRNRMDTLFNALEAMGASVPDPFMILSFLALPVIPALKLTDRGLFDVDHFKHVSLFVK